MSKPNVEVFNFVGNKTFRQNSITIAKAITTKIDTNNAKEGVLLNEIAENFPKIEDAVVCLVALMGGETKSTASAKVAYVDSLVRKVVFYRQENTELEFTLRNMQTSDAVFYDLSMEDLEKYGL